MSVRIAVLAGLAAVLAACSPGAPKGVDKAKLDDAVAAAVGDPSTCVLIAEVGGGQVYRYGTHQTCGRALPACDGTQTRTAGDLLDAVAARPAAVAASCPTAADGSRSVGWAAGPIPGRDLVYSAVMEGQTAPPGIVMADKLARAFAGVGLGG